MKQQDALALNFLECKDGHFRKLHGTRESVKAITRKGVGANPKQLHLSPRKKKTCFGKGGYLVPQLTDVTESFFVCLFGKVFCLQGGEEQCQSKPSQLIRKATLIGIYIYGKYRILGNFGNHFNLAIWRVGSQSPN